MEIMSEAQNKSSFYCWLILTVFIGGTLVFMVNFYNRTLSEISENSTVYGINLRQEFDNLE